jgi:type IV pilus assembly protein PilA
MASTTVTGGKKNQRRAIIILTLFAAGMFVIIFIPSHYRFAARAKQSEAKTNLKEIQQAQRKYFIQYGVFARTFGQLNWKPDQDRFHYTYFLENDVLKNNSEYCGNCGPYAKPDWLDLSSSPNDFVAAAVGNVDRDPDLDVWIINAEGEPPNVHNDADR